MKQHHPNRLDATRKTGHFWEHLRRAFAGKLSLSPHKPSTLTKLTMTNSQESDSIAEKPEVVQTEPKSNRWNWKTAIAVTLTAAVNAVSLASAIIQPLRQRLNQWNWRQKTALVTALAITAGGVFYQNRAHAAAFTWPAAIAVGAGIDFLVNVAASYASSSAINSKIKKTANANPDGEPLYRHREYHKRTYYYGEWADNNSGQNGHRIDAVATANQLQAYDTSGTDSKYSPSTLDADEVVDYYVNDNANLNGYTITYKILVEAGDDEWDHLHTDVSKYYNALSPRYHTISWGGYVTPPRTPKFRPNSTKCEQTIIIH